MKALIPILFLVACADITPQGSKVSVIETQGPAWQIQDLADKVAAQKNCKFIGYLDADTAAFPGSYSTHDNEIHSALKNRAAKVGANLVIADFYRKPAQGIGLLCPEESLH